MKDAPGRSVASGLRRGAVPCPARIAHLLAWFEAHARDLPWRRTRDPYAVWVSEIMLQQTQVKTVIPYWERWMRDLPNLEALAKAKASKIHKLWEGLGYYHRVRNMQRAAHEILERHGGKFPRSFEKVLELPGIGRYTAGAICSIAFDQPHPVLDGNVIRVLARLFGIDGESRQAPTNEALWQLAGDLVGQAVAGGDSASTFNQALMELGALVCTPRNPGCEACALAKDCVAFREGRVEQLPAKTPRAKLTPRRFAAFVVQHGDRFLVRQRPSGQVNAHLWEFPNVELANGDRRLRQAAHRALGAAPATLVEFCSIDHTITRYRIRLEVFRAGLPPGASRRAGAGSWRTRAQLHNLSFTGAHRRIVERLRAN